MSIITQPKPPFVWTIIEFDRNWRRTRYIERFLALTEKLSFVGLTESLEIGPKARSATPPRTLSRLADVLWRQVGRAEVYAEGNMPRPWSLGISVISNTPGKSNGRLTLCFSGDFATPGASDSLWETFRTLAIEEDATCSYIDCWDRWLGLRDEASPIVSQASFESVLWATFIDAETMRKFRRDQLDLSPAKAAEYTESGGLYLRLADTLVPANDTARAEMEQRRRQLLEKFLYARSY